MTQRGPILLLIALLLLTIPQSACADSVEILQVDTYNVSLAPGADATFTWSVRNVDDLGNNLSVRARIIGEGRWKVNITPADMDLAYKAASAFVLTLEVPDDAKGEKVISVEFEVLQGSAVIKYSLEKVTIEVIEPEEDPKVLDMWDNPLPEPLDGKYGVLILDVLVWLGISVLIVLIMSPFLKQFSKRSKTDLDDRILSITRTPIILIVFLYGAVSSLMVIEDDLGSRFMEVINRIYLVVFAVLVFYMIVKLFKEVVIYFGTKVASKTATEIDDLLLPLIEKVGFMIIGIFFLGYILNSAGIDLSLFIAGGVVISMVIAFAAQETLSNFFSGIFILTDRPFNRGDKIIFTDGSWYQVRKIGLRSTRLYRYADAALVTIPNNKLSNEMIINFSNPVDAGKVSMMVHVAYGTDPEKVKKILGAVIEKAPNIVSDDEEFKPVIRFDGMGDWALQFKIIVWLTDRSHRFTMIDYLNTEIHRRFAQQGVEIPFPQRVVHQGHEIKHGFPSSEVAAAKESDWIPPANDETKDEPVLSQATEDKTLMETEGTEREKREEQIEKELVDGKIEETSAEKVKKSSKAQAEEAEGEGEDDGTVKKVVKKVVDKVTEDVTEEKAAKIEQRLWDGKPDVTTAEKVKQYEQPEEDEAEGEAKDEDKKPEVEEETTAEKVKRSAKAKAEEEPSDNVEEESK